MTTIRALQQELDIFFVHGSRSQVKWQVNVQQKISVLDWTNIIIRCSSAVTLNYNSLYLSDAQEQQSVDMTGNPLTRHLRSKSYLFRS